MKGHSNPTIRTTADGDRVGPRMHLAVKLAQSVYPSKKQLAERVGPNGSLDYGYRIVDRCIRKGLISRPDPSHPAAEVRGKGAVVVTAKGRRYLRSHDVDVDGD